MNPSGHRPALPRRQRGVALITVLLVFAVVAVIAAEMLRRSQLNLRSVGNLIESRQAWYYALGGEALARQILMQDLRKNAKKDSLDESWAMVGDQQPFEADGGAIQIEIHDLQGRFNLNSVVDQQGVATGDEALVRLRQLFAAIGVSQSYADAWRDWVDNDQVATGAGAEDEAYPGYETAGAPEGDVSALRLLRNMTPEDYDKIAPHVATLPPGTPFNINTADAMVLRALGGAVAAQATQIRARQRQGGYADLAGLGSEVDVNALAVASNYFEVISTVKYADRILRLRSVLQRDQNSITVLSRSRLPFVATTDSKNSESPP